MTNAAAMYFHDEYNQSTEKSAAIASMFGFMNIFARGLGGYASDKCNINLGIRGRLFWQFFTLLIEGGAIVWFSFTKTLTMSILALAFTSLCVQFAEGSTFGIVPYVNRRYTGGVVGFVAAGGNVGGVIFAILFAQFGSKKSFLYMGISVICVSFISFFLKIKKDPSFHNADLIRVIIHNREANLCLPMVKDSS
uniref:Major facilitator superfamily (MFS) profile domain-containing protein n=1 Tax=Eucampia antarctica TaxID=49252 RepID=A0A7S2R1K6_9STRA|mmetsp:Transcript_13009/g.12650  ORF Transcript_13009/g.12650 Transcript_13009/m.12650 type:complete len:194 (+) Transcript_13009:37-618(+)